MNAYSLINGFKRQIENRQFSDNLKRIYSALTRIPDYPGRNCNALSHSWNREIYLIRI